MRSAVQADRMDEPGNDRMDNCTEVRADVRILIQSVIRASGDAVHLVKACVLDSMLVRMVARLVVSMYVRVTVRVGNPPASTHAPTIRYILNSQGGVGIKETI